MHRSIGHHRAKTLGGNKTVEYSPLAKLISVLSGSPFLAAWLFVDIFLPLLSTYILHRLQPNSAIFIASFVSITVILFSSLVILLGLGPPAGLDPVGFALFLFLIYSLPAWLASTLVIWGLLTLVRRLRAAA